MPSAQGITNRKTETPQGEIETMGRKRKPETPPPQKLSAEDRGKLITWARNHNEPLIRAVCRRGPGGMSDLVEECLIWHREHDVWRRDWVLTCENWIKKHVRWKAERWQDERPQYDTDKREAGVASVTHISDVLKGIR